MKAAGFPADRFCSWWEARHRGGRPKVRQAERGFGFSSLGGKLSYQLNEREHLALVGGDKPNKIDADTRLNDVRFHPAVCCDAQHCNWRKSEVNGNGKQKRQSFLGERVSEKVRQIADHDAYKDHLRIDEGSIEELRQQPVEALINEKHPEE